MQAVVESITHLGQLVNLDDVEVQVFTDSEYVCNGFNKGWLKGWLQNGWRNSKGKAVANQDLWEELLALTDAPNVTFTHVKGHSGNPQGPFHSRERQGLIPTNAEGFRDMSSVAAQGSGNVGVACPAHQSAGQVAKSCHHLGGVAGPYLGAVLVKGHVPHPMHPVLDVPMLP